MSTKINTWQETIDHEVKLRTGILDLSHLSLEKIPDILNNMTWLKELYLFGNKIAKIEAINKLVKLKTLNVKQNEIVKIEGLFTLPELINIDLSENKISKIEGLSKQTKLQNLNLSSNKITTIEGLEGLKEIKNIGLSYNEIISLENFPELKNLESLYLVQNKVTTISPLLPLLERGFDIIANNKSTSKSNIYINGNPISDPPFEIIDQGSDAILKFYKEKKKYSFEKLDILKVILVGNSQVGKTNFSQFLREGEITEASKSTHLLDIQKWDADFLVSEKGNKTRLHLFDFGGQDYYHDAHRMYYSHDTAYIVLWDTISNEYQEKEEIIDETGDKILYENFPLPYWLQSINYTLAGKFVETYSQNDIDTIKGEQKTKAPPILVLQNKIDIANGILNQAELSEKYPNIWSYFGVSLLKKKRTEILKELLSDYFYSLNLAGRMLLSYQLSIIQYFSDNTEDLLFIYSLKEFWNKCIEIINDPSVEFQERDALIMAHILNNIGIIFFHNHDESEALIFSDISILNEQVKKIMDHARKGSDKGVFLKKNIIKDTGIKNEEKILELLCSNKSIIKLSNEEYLAPQFLPTQANPSIQFFLHTFNHLQMSYVYPAYYHKSILLNLFANYARGMNGKSPLPAGAFSFWRNGIIVSKEEPGTKQMVLIEFVKNKSNAVINIKTMSPFSNQKLEGEIERLLDELNNGWTVEKMVSIDSNVFISVTDLQKKYDTKQFEFVKHGKRFRINDFKGLRDFKNRPKRLFISYSSFDRDYLKQFTTQIVSLRNLGLVETWDDREIQAGDKWDVIIKEQLEKADYVILFITANFLNSEYIKEVELKNSLDKNRRIIPVIIDYCTWIYDETIKDIQVLNKNTPLTSYSPISRGWVDVIDALKTILEK